MRKSQRGSITVIALIMLLFLVILGGAWTIMMTQEKTNALSDFKQQQAWYAAEAGYKRAAMLLTNSNSTWDIKTAAATLKDTNKIANWVKNTEGLNGDTDKGPWYAFSIVTQGTTTDLTAAASSGTYTITSVGQYMGERKVISHEVKITSTGGGGGGTTTPSLPGVIQAGNNITVTNSTPSITGDLYANSVTDQTWGGSISSGHWKSGQTYKDSFLTHLPQSLFDISTYRNSKNYAGELPLINSSTVESTMEAGKIYFIDLKNMGGNFYPGIDASNAQGATLVLYNSSNNDLYGTFQVNHLRGPSSGAPLTIISLLSGASPNFTLSGWNLDETAIAKQAGVTFKGELFGRIRIISNGSIVHANAGGWSVKGNKYTGKDDMYMMLSNGWIFLDEVINAPIYVSSDYVGTPTYKLVNYAPTISGYSVYMYKPFNGVVFTPGSVYVNTPIVYDNTVANDKYFTLPAGMTATTITN